MRLSNHTKYRLLEGIPGTVVWFTLIFSVVLSFWKPIWAIYFIILFDLYWLLRVCYFVFYLILAWRRYRRDIARDWYQELQKQFPKWQEMSHIIFLPTYREPLAVIDATLQSLSRVTYDPKRFIIVLAGEERDQENFAFISETMKEKYESIFQQFIVTLHPGNLPNEIPSKGSNLNWAGHRVKEIIDAQHIAYDKLIVSTFDIDTIVHRQYFACLTYRYLEHPNPQHTSFQPAVLYNNNIWNSPAITRIAAFGTTFWLMTELARPERLFTFSSHSMSWQALVDVGFWEKQIVTEDSRIFLQCFLRYDGDYTVTPMYIPVSRDVVKGKTYWRSLVGLYKQQRRWAWGIEHFPYMVWNFRRHPKIPRRKRLAYLWNLSEGMFSWAVAPLLIFILGRLPLYVAPESLQSQALLQNTPFVLETLLRLSMLGIFVSAALSLTLLPPRPSHIQRHAVVTMLLQWLLLPVTFVVFGSFAAIDAQTRLLLGRYLGFNVTEKAREGEST